MTKSWRKHLILFPKNLNVSLVSWGNEKRTLSHLQGQSTLNMCTVTLWRHRYGNVARSETLGAKQYYVTWPKSGQWEPAEPALLEKNYSYTANKDIKGATSQYFELFWPSTKLLLRRGYTWTLFWHRLTRPFCQYLVHVLSNAKYLCLFPYPPFGGFV